MVSQDRVQIGLRDQVELGMKCRAHTLALWAGCLLLLLAAGMLVKNESPSLAVSQQRLRVQQALAESAPCLTCHSAVADTSRLVIDTSLAYAAAETISPPASLIDPQAITKTDSAHIRQRWLEVGTRLLAVETRDVELYADAVDQFVAASEALDAGQSAADAGSALRTLDVAAALVLALEQQANPVQLRASVPLPQPESAEGNSAPEPPLPAALGVSLLGVALRMHAARLREEPAAVRSVRTVLTARRRGPPLGVAAWCLVGERRLRQSIAQSPFFMFDSGGRSLHHMGDSFGKGKRV